MGKKSTGRRIGVLMGEAQDQYGAVNAHLDALRHYGHQIHPLRDVADLVQQQDESQSVLWDATLLMSDVAGNCLAAEWLRRDRHPGPVIAICGQSPGEHGALLRLGVDWLLRKDDTSELLITVLQVFWQRLEEPKPGPMQGQHIGPWSLADHGWQLYHGDELVHTLLMRERALLLSLFESPGHIASFATLEDAVRRDWQLARGRPPKDPDVRGVLSRLRRRVHARGLHLPVAAIRDFGYAWTA